MPTGKPAQSGFTYLFVLMLIALIGMGLAAAGTLWHTESQREREADLLFIGDQYRQAIRSYYELDPAQPRLPQSLDDLLEDNRRPNVVRHLRRAWRDPLTGRPFVLIREPDTQGIAGVYSPAPGHPFKNAGFAAKDEAFKDAKSYAEWRFVFSPASAIAAGPASPQPPNPTQTPDSAQTPQEHRWVPASRAGNAGR